MKGTQDNKCTNRLTNSMHFLIFSSMASHGAGSACGKALGAVPSTTVGYEKSGLSNIKRRGRFCEIFTRPTRTTKVFCDDEKLNKVDRPLLTEVPKLKKLDYKELSSALAKEIKLVDARDKFSNGFIPGSISIKGTILCHMGGYYDEPFILLADESKLDDLTRKLMRMD
jgi:hydroxyacylglutathione hydrolase